MDKGVRRETVGSGIVRITRELVDLKEASPNDVLATLDGLAESWRWDRSLRPLIDWLEAQLPAIAACPGHTDERCCGRWQHPEAEGYPPCRGGNWRELEDLEWYIRDVHQRIGYLRDQVERGDTTGAAIFGVELGAAIIQLQLKQGPEVEWLWARDMKGKLGGASAARRLHPADHRREVVQSYLNMGRRIGRALDLAAKRLGVARSTVEVDWYEKKSPKPGD